MSLTPELNTQDIGGAAKVVSILGFAQPALLASGFAGFTTGRR